MDIFPDKLVLVERMADKKSRIGQIALHGLSIQVNLQPDIRVGRVPAQVGKHGDFKPMECVRPVPHPGLGFKAADPEILLMPRQLIGYLVEYPFHLGGQRPCMLPDVGPVQF